MFVDHARVRVTGGAGGNGCTSFRREKYVPRGGPDGGDGGNGGDVLFVADARLTSLLDLQYRSHWRGEAGVHGKGSGCHGRAGLPLEVLVPPGTQVLAADTGELKADLTEPGQRFLAGRGGRGGKGNARFATSTQRAPHFAERGEPGEDVEYLLELKTIAEVGLVGLPNAGKSTFLAAVTAARPKVADYPFTTLSPNLGVAGLSDYRTLTIADIPGLIEGAAQGKGLGHDFLRHVERTKVLLFLLDLGDPDPVATRDLLERELAEYSPHFAKRPRVFVLNKADIPENRQRFKEVASAFENPWLLSGVTGEGTVALLEHLWAVVDRVRREEAGMIVPPVEHEYSFSAPFTIERTSSGFRIEGPAAVRAVRMTDFSNDEAILHLQKKLAQMGVMKALKRMGAQAGESIHIGDAELEYHPE